MTKMRSVLAGLMASAFIVPLACGGGDDDNGGGGFGASSGTGGPPIGFSGSGGSGTGGGSSKSCMPGPDDSGCVGEQYAGETVPLDVYIMFDQSCSMSCPISRGGPGQCCMGDPNGRIFPVREAMDLFLHDAQSSTIGFGLGFFGYMPAGQTSCDEDDYDTPAVPIARSQADALVAELEDADPTGETPTGAAIRGACTYTQGWKRQNPSHAVVILLVTDGIPETPSSQCGANLQDAVQAAEDCAEDADTPIQTYVLGIGQALDNLNQIAEAGGTDEAHLVDGGNVTQSVLSALNTIRGDAAIPCELQIPPPPSGRTLDTNLVNVGICDGNGTNQTTFRVDTPAQCADGPGWYFSDPNSRDRIVLCEASCETVSVPGAQLFFSVGCATAEPPIR